MNLEHRLHAYALAATAAGVTTLALTAPAEGEIVYTKLHEVLPSCMLHQNLCFNLNFNHKKGEAEFRLIYRSSHSKSPSLFVWPLNRANAIIGVTTSVGGYQRKAASVLQYGAPIGFSNTRFQLNNSFMYGDIWSEPCSCTQAGGMWAKVKGGYLGLRFVIGGNTHYGWARFNELHEGKGAILTGFAYETIVGKSISAGQTKEKKTLGQLARPR